MSRTSERRARRAAAQRKQQQTSPLQNRNLWIYGGAALAVLAMIMIGYNVFSASGSTPPTGGSPTPGGTLAPVAVGTVVSFPSMGAQHIRIGETHAPYNSTPPTSGPHYDTPAPWTKPASQTIPEETWVHNLEHGGIVALYNCPEGCPELVSRLETLQKTATPSRFGYVKLLIVPYNKIPNKLTLVAWQHYLPLADYDDTAARNFMRTYQDKGPEDAG